MITFGLSDLESSMSGSLSFRRLISCKGAEFDHRLLVNINRKACMGNPLVRLYLTLSDLERSMSRSLSFRLISLIGAELGHVTIKHQ